jgi:hypothetical protein
MKKISNGLLQSLKDCLIFGTSTLISQLPIEYNSQLIPVSASEEYLRSQEIDFNKYNDEISTFKIETNCFSLY